MVVREALVSLAVAVAAGALIGLERERSQRAQGQPDFGGVRTFPLIALVGAASAMLRPAAGAWLPGAALAVVGLLLVSARAREGNDDPGVSSEMAALVAFAIGAISATPEVMEGDGRFLVVAGLSAMTMALLALKRPLHSFADRVSPDDLYATVKFALLAGVFLPVLPDRDLGPFGALNPAKIGLMIVLIAAIGFAGYVASRVVGTRRGVLVSGLIGGLVSSTAVAMTFAGRAKREPALARDASVAIVAASATMFARVLVVVSALDRGLLPAVAPPFAAAALAGFAAAALVHLRAKREPSGGEDVPFRNPFELGQAVRFGLLYGAVRLVAKASQHYLGQGGVLVSSVLAGLTDVDAITITLTDLHKGGLGAGLAAGAVAAASATNTLVKAGLALSLGGRAVGLRVAASLLFALAAGGAALAATALLR